MGGLPRSGAGTARSAAGGTLRRLVPALLVTALLVAPAAVLPTGSAAAAEGCQANADPSPPIEDLPWAVATYDPRTQLWPLSTGAGVTVAVVGSGVDGSHQQLAGHVLPGFDFLRNVPDANLDCVPADTGLAGIIAGQPVDGIGFTGLAPDATILPVRVSENVVASPEAEPVDPGLLAAGIVYAVANDADVIVTSVVTYADDPEVAAAVELALLSGVSVVASAGNGHPERLEPGEVTPTTAFPAAYPSVLGVGSIDQAGVRIGTSPIAQEVALVAPGEDVIAPAIGGHTLYSGSGIAAGFAAASVALVYGQDGAPDRSAGLSRVNGTLTGLLSTAGATAGGGSGGLGYGVLGYGTGLVNPAAALREAFRDGLPSKNPSTPVVPATPGPDEVRYQAVRNTANSQALLAGSILAGLLLVALAIAVFAPRARRRRWAAGRDREPAVAVEEERPEFLPGEMLFERTGPP